LRQSEHAPSDGRRRIEEEHCVLGTVIREEARHRRLCSARSRQSGQRNTTADRNEQHNHGDITPRRT
jgi:hypothetical protein